MSWLDKACRLLETGRDELALTATARHLAEEPGCAEAYELRAVANIRLERWPDAVEAALQALQIDPLRRDCYRALARAHEELGQPEQATAALLAGIAHLPHDGHLCLDAALLLRDGGLDDQALALLDAAVERCTAGRWEVEHLRLELLMATGRYDQATAAARAILSREPDDISALDRLSAACYGSGDLDGAIAAAEQVMTRTPGLHENELRLAGLLREDGQLPRAVALFEHVAGHASVDDQRDTAVTALRLMDDSQIPLLLLLAGESRHTRRELRADPAGAAARRGFFLSQAGLARLMAALADAPGQAPLH